MATSSNRTGQTKKVSLQPFDSGAYRIPLDSSSVVSQVQGSDVMGVLGWITAVVLVAFMLPLLAWMYLDVLSQKQEVKQQTEQIERLRRKIERKENDKKPISINDNLLFDRVRRPLSLPLPRPKELE
jgi:hypothetical protein